MKLGQINSKFGKMLRLALFIFVAAMLGSCATPEPKENKEKEKKPEDLFAFLHKDKEVAPKKSEPAETAEQEQVKAEEKENVSSIQEKIKKLPEKALQPKEEKKKAPLHFYDDFIILNGDEELDVKLVFNSAPLLDVIPFFADTLGFNFLADSDLKGVVTLNIDQKMSRKDLWNTFDRMLNLSGAGVTVDGTLLRIMSLSKLAQQSDSRLARDGSGELFYYPLKNTTAKDVIAQIKPFLGKDSLCVELTRPNAVMVADDRANMPKIRQLLEIIDKSGKSNWKRKVIKCSNILPSKLSDELKTVLPVLGFNVLQTTDKSELPGSIQLTGLDRLQLIVVSAATDEAIKEIEQWIDLLDSSDSLDQERVFVYKVRHTKAAQLAQALSVLYDTQGASLTIDTTTGNTRTDAINSTVTNTRNRTTANPANNPTAAMNNVENTRTDKNSNVFDTPVRVFSDGVLNRLVVRTTPRTYASIKALLNRLDVVPAQVLLQVLVVEVTLTESTQFGLELSGQNKVGGANSLIGTNYSNLTTPSTTSTTDNLGNITKTVNKQSGFTYFLSDPDNPDNKFAYVRALAGNGNIKVVSSPQLLVSSHTEAVINVGSDVSVRTQSLVNSNSGDGNITYNFEYKTTGIILTVTPEITSNDLISLKVKQELSSVDYSVVTSENPNPNIDQRIVDTSMTIAHGKTMVLGGLIQEKKNDSLSSVPIINQIPVLNRLLGSTDASVSRTEILVLVTGYIVNERNKVEELISRYNDALRALNDFDENIKMKKNSPQQRKPHVITDKEFWNVL